MVSNVWRDVRYALCTFRRSPGFAFAAIAPIALGIGINTGIFSILNSLALRPLSTPDSTELVTIHQQFRGVQERRSQGSRSMFSMPEYRTYRDRTQTLSGLMAFSRPWTFTVGGQSPELIDAVLVTCNYFDVLQLRPLLGPRFVQYPFVVVQLNLPAGRGAHGVLYPPIWAAKANLLQFAPPARFPWKTEELDGTVPSVASHPEVGRGDPRRTRYAALASVGFEIYLELVLAEVFAVCERPKFGHHFYSQLAQLCADVG